MGEGELCRSRHISRGESPYRILYLAIFCYVNISRGAHQVSIGQIECPELLFIATGQEPVQ